MTDTLQEAHLAVELMPIGLVRPAVDNPRDTLGELEELVNSIADNGILQPLLVQGTGELGEDDVEIHVIIAGHRRHAAALLAELEAVPVIVRNDIDEQHRQAAMFIENFHRLDLGPIEKARALQQLADAGVVQREIAEKVGITQPTVSKWLSLLKLPEKAQKWVTEEKLTQETAVSLAGLPAEKVSELTASGPPSEWSVQEARQKIERDKVKAKAEKEVKAKGWAVLGESPDWEPQMDLEGKTEPCLLDEDRDDCYGLLGHVNPSDHEHEPCHAVFIESNGSLAPACTNPSAHPRPEGWKSPAEIQREESLKEIAAARGPGKNDRISKMQLERDGQKVRIDAAMQPLNELCRAAIGQVLDHQDHVINFAVKSLLTTENALEYTDMAARLLGIADDKHTHHWGWAMEVMAEGIDEPGRSNGAEVIYAIALADGLAQIEGILWEEIRKGEPDDDEVGLAMTFLSHLDGQVEDVPTIEALIASLDGPLEATEPDETLDEAADDAPHVEVFAEGKKFYRRCSACGRLDGGGNTNEGYAVDRANVHLRDTHGIAEGGDVRTAVSA